MNDAAAALNKFTYSISKSPTIAERVAYLRRKFTARRDKAWKYFE